MKTNAQRLPVMPTSGGTSWLFWITLSFGFFLAVYTPYELWAEAAQQIDRDGPSLAAFGVYFLGGLAELMGLRWCILFILSYSTMAKREREQLLPSDAELPFVSILAPAYCEAAWVKDAMSALVRLDYPAYEVIFVDDGSTDDTHQLALAFAGNHYSEYGRCEVRVFTKPNGGKWSAHNYGLRHASGSLILCIDADSRIETGALKLMVRHMRDKRVGAVSGQIRVRNRGSFFLAEELKRSGLTAVCASYVLDFAQNDIARRCTRKPASLVKGDRHAEYWGTKHVYLPTQHVSNFRFNT